MTRNRRGRFFSVGGALYFAAFFLAPLSYFYFRAAAEAGPGGFAAALEEVLSSPATWRTLVFSLAQAAASALFCVALALPGALISARRDFPGKKILRSAGMIPFVLPSIIVVIAMIGFYGKNGLLNRLFGTELNLIYNPAGIVLAHGFYNVTLALRIMGEGFAGIDLRYHEIAASLGDGPVRRFLRILLPLGAPAAATAFIIIFLYSFSSFGIVLVFGGVAFSTLEVKTYTEMHVKLNLSTSSVYALLQLVLAVFFMLLAGKLIRRFQFSRPRAPKTTIPPGPAVPPGKKAAALLYFLILGIFIFGPLASLTIRSLRPMGVWSARAFAALFRPEPLGRDIEGIIRSGIPGVILRSLLLSFGSGSAAFLLALALSFALRGRKSPLLEGLLYLPTGMSMVSLGIGLRLLYGETLPLPLLIGAAQVFVAFPVVFRILRTTVEEFHPAYLETAESLGAGKGRALRDVAFPILRRGLLNGLAYSVAIPFTDFTLVMTIGRGEYVTFPVAIYRLIGFRSFDLGMALGVLYILVCLGIFFWIDSTGGSDDTFGGN